MILPNPCNWCSIKKAMNSTQKKLGFTLIELLVAITIIGILAAIGLGSFSSSQMKARDSRRKADMTNITKALEFYYNDRGQYPADDGAGRIMGCGTVATPTACTYGGTFVQGSTTYMTTLPADPAAARKYFYVRIAANQYRLYAGLENTLDTISLITPASANTDCQVVTGIQACNYGVSSSNTTP